MTVPPEPPDSPESGQPAESAPLPDTGPADTDAAGTEAADTEVPGTAHGEAAGDDAATAGTEAGESDEFEGPRRRARRERAERRAAQDRARAIEEARREAKRRAHGGAADAGKDGARSAVRGLRVLLFTVLITVLTVGLGLILYFTPLMSVRDIAVVGTALDHGVTAEQVVEVAQVPIGTPLLQVNTNRVADRVATIRQLASARVQREYPSTLRITVAERIPVAVKDFPDGPRLYDRDGVDFTQLAPPQNLPYLDVDNPGPNDAPTKAALAVLTSLRPEVAGQVGRVTAPSVASITLILVDGREVVWGTHDRTAEKAEKLSALLTQPGRVYDVSSPDLPTIK